MATTYTPIEVCGFKPRTLNALINGGITSVELLIKNADKIASLRGMGGVGLQEIEAYLTTYKAKVAEESFTTLEKAELISLIASSTINENLKLKALYNFIK